ncbi:MAG: Spy/CpxP family protein refolding chaperone [Gallionellaceae bacterium]
MNKSIKSILTTSLIASALMGTTIYSAAAETGTPGPQMMQGQRGGGQGYGPGMMGEGYGPGSGMNQGGGYGPGMMGGGMGQSQGYGMGMMGMTGAGMGLQVLDLNDEQAAKVDKIQTETITKQRTLMRQMWDEQQKLGELYANEKRDPAAIGKVFDKVSDLQRQAMENRIEAENKVEALLSKEQKTKLHRGYGRGMMGW